MDILTALRDFWPLLVFVFGGTAWLVRLEFRQTRDNADMREQLAGVRKDLGDLETKAEHDRLTQNNFQLSVTDRLARIETTISTGIRDIQSAIRDAIKP